MSELPPFDEDAAVKSFLDRGYRVVPAYPSLKGAETPRVINIYANNQESEQPQNDQAGEEQ